MLLKNLPEATAPTNPRVPPPQEMSRADVAETDSKRQPLDQVWEKRDQDSTKRSRVVRVDELLVGGVRVQAHLKQALGLVDQGADGRHLRLDGVAEVCGLCLEIVGLLAEETLQLVRLRLDAGVGGLTVASQGRHRLVLGHVL